MHAMKRRSFLASSSLSGLAITQSLSIGAFHAPAGGSLGMLA